MSCDCLYINAGNSLTHNHRHYRSPAHPTPIHCPTLHGFNYPSSTAVKDIRFQKETIQKFPISSCFDYGDEILSLALGMCIVRLSSQSRLSITLQLSGLLWTVIVCRCCVPVTLEWWPFYLMMAPKLKSSDANNWILQREAITSFF